MDNLLFFGELPPASLHGASISNATNIEMLKENFNIIIVIEQSNIKVHGAISILKIITFLSDCFNF